MASAGGQGAGNAQDAGVNADGMFSRWSRRVAAYWQGKKEPEVEPVMMPTPADSAPRITMKEVEVATNQKRIWLKQQHDLGGVEQLVSWPDNLVEAFYVVGLPPDTEVTQIACDLAGHHKAQREPPSDMRSSFTQMHMGAGQPPAGSGASVVGGPSGPLSGRLTLAPRASGGIAVSPRSGTSEPAPPSPFAHFADQLAADVRDIAGSALSGQMATPAEASGSQGSGGPYAYAPLNVSETAQPSGLQPTSLLAARGGTYSDASLSVYDGGGDALSPDRGSVTIGSGPSFHRFSRVIQAHDKPPQPAYPAAVLYRHPGNAQVSLSDEQVSDLCFPHQVAPRRLRRSPSWSALHGVISHKSHITAGTAYTFVIKSAASLPLYGVCYLVEEPLHRPPTLAQASWPACTAPYRQCLITAPRAYCILSHYPFFSLFCQALNLMVGLERLNRSLAFSQELQHHPTAGPTPPPAPAAPGGPGSTARPGQPPPVRTGRQDAIEECEREGEGADTRNTSPLASRAASATTAPGSAALTPLSSVGGAPRTPKRATFAPDVLAADLPAASSPRSRLGNPPLDPSLLVTPPRTGSGGGGGGGAATAATPPARPHPSPLAATGASNDPAKPVVTSHTRHASATSFHTAVDTDCGDLDLGDCGLGSATCDSGTSTPAQLPSPARAPSSSRMAAASGGLLATTLPEGSTQVQFHEGYLPSPAEKSALMYRGGLDEPPEGFTAENSEAGAGPLGLQFDSCIEPPPDLQLPDVQGTASAGPSAGGASDGLPALQHTYSPQSGAISSYGGAPRPDSPELQGAVFAMPAGDAGPSSSTRSGSESPIPQQPQFNPLSVVDALLAAPVPPPGDRLLLPVPGLPPLTAWRNLLSRRCPWQAPAASLSAYADEELAAELAPWATCMLAKTLPLESLLTVLNAALLERPVVFFHPNPALVSSCVLGVLPMLRPFSWQCPLLPLMPSSAMHILDAPVPFLVGCQYKTADVASRCVSLVRVNLYKGSVSNAAGLPPLPGLKRLLTLLAPHHARLRTTSAGTRAGSIVSAMTEEQATAASSLLTELYAHLAGTAMPALEQAAMMAGSPGGLRASQDPTALLASLEHAPSNPRLGANGSVAAQHGSAPTSSGGSWWGSLGGARTGGGTASASAGKARGVDASNGAGVVGDLRPHVITHVGSHGERTATLMRESLIEVQPAKDRAWVKMFTETQMFEVYSDHVISTLFESRARA